MVVDAASGAVLSAEAPNHLWYPASLTKMMTVYVALSEIKAGRLSLEDKIMVSERAAQSSGPVRPDSRREDHGAAGDQCRDRRVRQ